jgi:hypothetical protein
MFHDFPEYFPGKNYSAKRGHSLKLYVFPGVFLLKMKISSMQNFSVRAESVLKALLQ